MKHKHKNKKKAQKLFKSKVWRKKHDPFVLVVVLVIFIALELISLNSATTADWQDGFGLMDVSNQLADTISDLHQTVQPMIDVAGDINLFFQKSAGEMAYLLNDEESVIFVADGLTDFLRIASREAYQLFDVAGSNPWLGKVAGMSIENTCSN